MLRQYASLSSREHALAAAAKRREEWQGANDNTAPVSDGADQIELQNEADEREGVFDTNDHGIQRTLLHRIERWFDEVWLAHELDMVLALLLSIGLLILSIVSYHQRKSAPSSASSGGLNPRADLSVYKSQMAASVLFVTGSLFSILICWRRKVTSRRDSYVGRRRTVLSFLKKLDSWEEAEGDGAERPHVHVDGHAAMEEAVQLSGTALTDVYSVYRLSSSDPALSACGQWHKVPSLLLVDGDFISLQVGDTAPANCALVPIANSRSGKADATDLGSLHLTAGERFTGTAVTFSTIPVGRSTLKPENSRELLELCNRTNIFVVTKTPLIDALAKGHGKLNSLLIFTFHPSNPGTFANVNRDTYPRPFPLFHSRNRDTKVSTNLPKGTRVPPSFADPVNFYAYPDIRIDICPANVVGLIATTAASTTRLVGDTASMHSVVRILSGSVWHRKDSYNSAPFCFENIFHWSYR